MTNIVKDPFIKQSHLKLDSIKCLIVMLETVAAPLDILERLSRHPALSSPSDQEREQTYNVDVDNIVALLPS